MGNFNLTEKLKEELKKRKIVFRVVDINTCKLKQKKDNSGDFEISDYRQQAFYELWLLDERLKTERKKYLSHESWVNRRDIIEKQQYDRYHKLMNAFDKEEPKIWDELIKELANDLRHLGSDKLSRIDLINELAGEFDGTTLEFYEYLKNYNK